MQMDIGNNVRSETIETVLAATVATPILIAHLPGRRNRVVHTITVTSGTVDTAFILQRAAVDGGTMVTLLSGSGFSTASAVNPFTSSTYAFPIAANTPFQIDLYVDGWGEYQFVATSSAGATVKVETSYYVNPNDTAV